MDRTLFRLLVPLLIATSSPAAATVINEIHADPDASLGDANGDGVVNSGQDEFIELYNDTGAALDISGWTLSDDISIRHVFPPSTIIAADGAIVVFGGGTPTGTFGGSVVQTASTGGFSLTNGSDTVTLQDGIGVVVAYAYGVEGGQNQSITRDPDITGTDPLVLHGTATGSGGALFSPGTRIDGTRFGEAPRVVINEIHADPDASLGDANGDGVVNSGQDEFIELYNDTGAALNISGWTLSDDISIRHVFPPSTIIAADGGLVVFGGGTPTGTFGGSVVQTASTGGFSLTNGSDTVTLQDGIGVVVAYAYGVEGGQNQSITRDPDITGTDPLVLHGTATGSGGALFSPGTRIDGTRFGEAPRVVINEIHADPDASLGDANGDGVVNSGQDEFIELYNDTGAALDISGWTLSDDISIRHVFPPSTIIAADGAIVVFGGGTPTGTFGGSVVQTASTGGFSLTNGSDTVTLQDGIGVVVAYAYGVEGGQNQSITRDPDITGTDPLVLHGTATGSGGALFSPGTRIDGTRFGEAPRVVINEIHADPDASLGDANGDGVVSTAQDEFIELYNDTGAALDISGWTLSDDISIRHVFPPSTIIAADGAIVVFGGGTPTGTFGGSVVQTASTGGFSLTNGSDTVTLQDGIGVVVAYAYGVEGGQNQSITRDPDITGTDPLVLHGTATGSGGALFSPGTRIDGTRFGEAPRVVINEIHADPDASLGDANGDGVVSTAQDEFIELYNDTGAALDISGWTLSDDISIRHVFPPSTIIAADGAIVVFGGGTPTGTFGGSVVQTASTGGFSLTNGSDTVTLQDGIGVVVAYAYGVEGGQNQSITRDPDITGTDPLVLHGTATGSGGALFSPGTRIDGTRFVAGVVGAPVVSANLGFHLAQNWPNPLGSATIVRYALLREGHVAIRVFDVRGRLVETLANGVESSGPHEIVWRADGSGASRIASGIYFLEMRSGQFRAVRKAIVRR